MRKAISILTLFTVLVFIMAGSGCKKEEFNGRQATYNLATSDILGVSGTATFNETSKTVSTIDIVLAGAPSGTHPAELCMNTMVEGGAIVLTLNPVDETGKSSTAVTSITFDQLIAYDGFIKVHKSASEPNIILAQGDIGGNVITTTNISYPLGVVGSFGVSGTALFEKRVNGNTLVTISLTGIIAGDEYPATINLGSIESVGGGPIVKTLSDVDGTNGKSFTNIRQLDGGTAVTYDNWLVYDGYINIYQISPVLENIISQGNIGSN
jgi:hypothetical protein